MSAIASRDAETVERLLTEGADPNYIQTPDEALQPTSPLKMVVFCVSDAMLDDDDRRALTRIARLLLEHGADPEPAQQLAQARYGNYEPGRTGSAFSEVLDIIYKTR